MITFSNSSSPHFISALGVAIFKSIMFVIHLRNLKTSDDIISNNSASIKAANQQAQQIQKTMSSIDNVVDWRYDDPRLLSDDLKQQFLTKSRSRRTPTSDRASPRERIPLATTDFDVSTMNEYHGGDMSRHVELILSDHMQTPLQELSDDENRMDAVPIYTYNPNIGGTQV